MNQEQGKQAVPASEVECKTRSARCCATGQQVHGIASIGSMFGDLLSYDWQEAADELLKDFHEGRHHQLFDVLEALRGLVIMTAFQIRAAGNDNEEYLSQLLSAVGFAYVAGVADGKQANSGQPRRERMLTCEPGQ